MNTHLKRGIFCLTLALCILSAYKITAQTPGTPDWIKRGGAWDRQSYTGDGILDIKTDKHGNVYVLSQNYGKINIDGQIAAPDSTAKHSLTSWDCNGNFRWMKTCGGTANRGVFPSFLAVDTMEGIYIMGDINNIQPTDTSYLDIDKIYTGGMRARFIAKYSSSGQFQWIKTPHQSSGSIADKSVNIGLSVSPIGDVFWLAYLTPGVYDNGAFTLIDTQYCVIQYSPSGSFLKKTVLDMNSAKNQSAYLMQFDYHAATARSYIFGTYDSTFGTLKIGNTNITATGLTNSQNTRVAYVAVFDSSGQNLWVKQGSADKNHSIHDALIDHEGNSYLLITGDSLAVFNGDTLQDNSIKAIFSANLIAAMDTSGNKLWSQSLDGYYGGVLDYKNGFLAAYYNKYINFSTYNTLMFIDAVNGNLLGEDSIGKVLSIAEHPISFDKNNNIYIGGSFVDSVNFGSVIINKIDTGINQGDWFIAKYENTLCGCDLPQPNFNIANPTGNTYNFYYNGSQPFTSISWDFGDGSPPVSFLNASHSYTANGSYPVCVTVTNGCGTNKICKWVHITTATGMDKISDEDGIFLYPNPAKDKLHIRSAQTRTVLEIYNLKGQKILQTALQKQQEVIDINSLAPGVYLLRFTDDKGRAVSRKLIKE